MNKIQPFIAVFLGFVLPTLLCAQDKEPTVEVVVAAHKYEFYGDVINVLTVLKKHSINDFKLVEAKEEGIFVSIITTGDPNHAKTTKLAKAIGELKVTVQVRRPVDQWADFSNEHLAKLGAQKTVILVRADWCPVCERLEKKLKVFQDPKIVQMIRKHDLHMLRLDMTDVKDKETQSFLDSNNVKAVPTLIVFAKGANKKPEAFHCPTEPMKIVREIEKRIANHK